MAKERITTIIPTYRRPAMLRRAIRSVLSQTYPDFRLSIYDNASGDETASVAEEFCRSDSRVEYVRRPENIGAFANFMDGASRVETPYFSFLPDDDLMLPHFLECAIAGFRQHPEAAMSILVTLHMSPRGRLRYAWVMQWAREGLLTPPEGMLLALRHGNPGLPAMLMRREVWQEFGGFDEFTDPGSDLDFQLRVTALRPVVVSMRPGAIQVMHEDAQTAGSDLRWIWPPLPRIMEKISEMDLPPAEKQQALQILTGWTKKGLFLRGGLRSIAAGKRADAEQAADLLEQEYGLTSRARIIRTAAAVSRLLPGTGMSIRALFELRNWQKAIRDFGLQRQFRPYAKFLRSSEINASSPSPGRAASALSKNSSRLA